MKLGIKIQKNKEEIKLQRTTKETTIIANLNSIKEKQLAVKTTIPFLDHMIETLGWRANLNIGVQVESAVKLNHPIVEDTGIALGRIILEFYKTKMAVGVEGCGFARGIIDEAYADVAISIEGRNNSFIDGPSFENVDGISGYDLVAFFEGFCQGCKCTLKVSYSGKDPHHSWEVVFRAFGFAIRKAFEPNNWRKGTISGIKGTLD